MCAATNHIQAGFLPRIIRFAAYGFVAGALFFHAGCIKDEAGYVCGTGTIEIRPAIADGRITGNSFESGDRIGLYVAVSPGVPGSDNYAANMVYTFDGAGWTGPGGIHYPWPSRSAIDVYAYQPYDPALATMDPRRYLFTVGTDQSTRESFDGNDFLWARTTGRVPTEGAVPLLFSHLLSRVRVNIKASMDAGVDWPQRAQVAVTGLLHGGMIDLADGMVAPAITQGGTAQERTALPGPDRIMTGSATPRVVHDIREREEIIPLRLEEATPGYELSFDAIVMPQEVAAGLPLVRITLDGKSYVFLPADNVSFAPGENLTINLTLTDRWPGLILDLADVDWDRSQVWDIYNGNRPVGRVCREYLFRNNAPGVDLIAEVVYPLDGTGRPVLGDGFVARVYNRTPNRQQGRYEYNTASVHGGSVVFGTANTLDTYTAGNMPQINKVSLISGRFEAAPDTEAATLVMQPWRLADVDLNEYPIVKIGTQYWMSKNYYAEHYNDGTALTYYYYDDSPSIYKHIFGALYPWDTAVAAGFAPAGWRLPSQEDWRSLWNYLYPEMGRKIKSFNIWSPNTYSDNASGFSALPAGRRTNTGAFNEYGSYGQWWGSTQISNTVGYRLYVGTDLSVTESSLDKSYAESVRLMREN